MNIGNSTSQTRDLSVGGRPLPVGATANLDLDLKGSIITLAGEYAAVADPPKVSTSSRAPAPFR